MISPLIKSFLIIAVILSTGMTQQAGIRIGGRLTVEGKPASNYRVELTNLETNEVFKSESDSEGNYVIQVPRGRYNLKVYLKRIEVDEIKEIIVAPGRSSRYDLALHNILFFKSDENEKPKPVIQPPPPPPPPPSIRPFPTPVPTISGTPGKIKVERPPTAGETPPSTSATPEPVPAPATSPTPQSSTSSSDIDEIFKNLRPGNIAFNSPSVMRLDQIAAIELLLSPSKTIEELKQAISEPGRIETAQIKISDYMEATLTGPGFEITAVTPQRQLVSKSEDTTWKWNIKAASPGVQRLNLTLNVIIEDKGKERLRSLHTYSKEIAIEVTVADRVKGFVEKYWQWLWATILFPLGLYLWRRFFSKKKDEDGRP